MFKAITTAIILAIVSAPAFAIEVGSGGFSIEGSATQTQDTYDAEWDETIQGEETLEVTSSIHQNFDINENFVITTHGENSFFTGEDTTQSAGATLSWNFTSDNGLEINTSFDATKSFVGGQYSDTVFTTSATAYTDSGWDIEGTLTKNKEGSKSTTFEFTVAKSW